MEFNFLVDITSPDLSRRNTLVPPPHVKQVIKAAEKVDKASIEAKVKTYEDLKSKYDKLQDETVSLSDIKKLIPQNEEARAKEAKSTRAAKEGTSNDI